MDKFMEAHGDELPFDNPEADQPVGFIKISPPVDLSDIGTDKKIEITVESKAASKEEKGKEKKKSVKEKLSAGKAKVAKEKKTKVKPDKDLQAAM